MRPDDRQYTRSHEWVKAEGDEALIGITDYAVAQLEDLVYLDLPEPGDSITKGQPFGEIESVKAQADLYAPVSGEVIETNETLPDDLDTLAKDPYDAGWMIKVKIEDPAELEKDLMTAAAYEAFLAAEKEKQEKKEA